MRSIPLLRIAFPLILAALIGAGTAAAAETVTTTAPTDGASGVNVLTQVAVTFSADMDHAATEAAFGISGGVTGTFAWSGTTLIFTPDGRLADTTVYTVTIGTGALDLEGTPLAAPYSLAFTSATAAEGAPLPAGWIAHLLHLGSQQDLHITGSPTIDPSITTDDFIYAGWGPEYVQQPGPGVAVDLRVASDETPMVWTAIRDADGNGLWSDAGSDQYREYFALNVIVPSDRDARIGYWIDDKLRVWLDGAPTPLVAIDANDTNQSAVFTLTAGLHRFVFKMEELTSSNVFAVKFLNADGSDMTDLRYQVYDLTPPGVADFSAIWDPDGAALRGDLRLTFSEPMDTSIAPDTFASIDHGAVGTWSWTDRLHLCWTPAAGTSLASTTTYTVSLAAGVARDVNGNPLPATTLPFFTAEVSRPTLSAISPVMADTGAPLSLVLTGGGFTRGAPPHVPGAVPAPGSMPFSSSFYAFITTNADWETARAQCLALGGHLPTIDSAVEDEFVWQLGGRSDAWLGISDRASEGTFAWDDGSAVGYVNWAPGQPDDSGGSEDYGSYYRATRQWNDAAITRSQPYVCEFDRPAVPAVRLTRGAETISGTVEFIATGELHASFDLAGATVGWWSVEVENPDGAMAWLNRSLYIGNGANHPPTFTVLPSLLASEDGGTYLFFGLATDISPGPAAEAGQSVSFTVTTAHPGLFAVQPTLDADGTLSFTLAANANGDTRLFITAHDDGGTAGGGSDTSVVQTVMLTVTAVDDPPVFTAGASLTVNEDAGPVSIPGWATGISGGPAEPAIPALTVVEGGRVIAVDPAYRPTSVNPSYGLPLPTGFSLVTFDPAVDLSHVLIGDQVTLTITEVPYPYPAQYDGTYGVLYNADAPIAGQPDLPAHSLAVTYINSETYRESYYVPRNLYYNPFAIPAMADPLPSFTATAATGNLATVVRPGQMTVPESAQAVTLYAITANPALFTIPPGLTSDGTLSFTPAPDANGTTTVTVYAYNWNSSGGVTSAGQPVTITIAAVNDPPRNIIGPTLPAVTTPTGTLTAETGTWDDLADGVARPALTFTYRWVRMAKADGSDAVAIPGATHATYTTTYGDDGLYVAVEVTARDSGVGLPAHASATARSSFCAVTNGDEGGRCGSGIGLVLLLGLSAGLALHGRRRRG